MYTEEKLKELQALSLEDKIALSKIRITEFYLHRRKTPSFSYGDIRHVR